MGEGTAGPAAHNFATTLGLSGGFTTSPRTNLQLRSGGYLATPLGVRAFDALAARDPFMQDRTEYALDAGSSFGIQASRATRVELGAGYNQAGAVDAVDPSAVGIDSHTGSASLGVPHEIGLADTLGPEVRYEGTHFYHALLDVDLTRGPLDVHTGTLVLREQHRLTRRLTSDISGGVTVASPNPIVDPSSPVVSPAASAALSYATRRIDGTASYQYAYTSLGPRIGFGQEHTAAVEVDGRPLEGGRFRDFVLRGIGRASYGRAPVAAAPPLVVDPSQPPTDLEGNVTTYTVVAGAQLEVPLARGVAFLGGFDLQYAAVILDRGPVDAGIGTMTTIATIGIVGVLSTDPRLTLRPGREDPEDERSAPDRELTDERRGDLTVGDRERLDRADDLTKR
jgi:hypothetical protein